MYITNKIFLPIPTLASLYISNRFHQGKTADVKKLNNVNRSRRSVSIKEEKKKKKRRRRKEEEGDEEVSLAGDILTLKVEIILLVQNDEVRVVNLNPTIGHTHKHCNHGIYEYTYGHIRCLIKYEWG